MTRISRWWRARSGAERLDLFTRWPLYVVSASEPLLLLGVLTGQRLESTGAAAVLMALSGVHTLVCLAVLHRSLRHLTAAGPRPGPALLGLLAALTAAGAVAAVALLLDEGQPGEPVPVWLATAHIFLLTATAAAAPLLRPAALAALVAAPFAPAAAGVAVLGRGDLVPGLVPIFIWTAAVAVSYRGSAWFLSVVRELDRARVTQAHLAVAEERLRFARDLHDVLGRNLTVIAVHSDLAGQLLRRGHDGAAEHLATVHRTAGESLRELREVIGGYRAADLDTELGGARSVLDAAGITTRVTGSAAGLPHDVQVALGWVVREAVTNILRHAEPADVGIRLDVTRPGPGDEPDAAPAAVVLRVENDGARTLPPRGEGGTGLAGLAERLSRAGGALHAGPEPGGRFRVEARLPLPPPGSAEAQRLTEAAR